MSVCLVNWASGATIVLAVFAVVGTIFAIKNLCALKKKYRYDILVSLTDQINKSEERHNRARIHGYWASKQWSNDMDVGDKIYSIFVDVWNAERNRKQIDENDENKVLKDAIEATVACLDKIGYFLMERDKIIQKETPIQIWSIADDMWRKLGTFVEKRQEKRQEVWATYFKILGHKAKLMMDEWRRLHPKGVTTKCK